MASSYGPSKAAFLYTLMILGWILFLGPQLEPHVATVKQRCLRLWDQWQSEETTPINNATAGYTTRIMSYDPFIMHIENFVTPEEREYILQLG